MDAVAARAGKPAAARRPRRPEFGLASLVMASRGQVWFTSSAFIFLMETIGPGSPVSTAAFMCSVGSPWQDEHFASSFDRGVPVMLATGFSWQVRQVRWRCRPRVREVSSCVGAWAGPRPAGRGRSAAHSLEQPFPPEVLEDSARRRSRRREAATAGPANEEHEGVGARVEERARRTAPPGRPEASTAGAGARMRTGAVTAMPPRPTACCAGSWQSMHAVSRRAALAGPPWGSLERRNLCDSP